MFCIFVILCIKIGETDGGGRFNVLSGVKLVSNLLVAVATIVNYLKVKNVMKIKANSPNPNLIKRVWGLVFNLF